MSLPGAGNAFSPSVTVRRAAPHEWELGLSLLGRGIAEPNRSGRVLEALDAANAGEFPLEGLLVAERHGQFAGAALSVLQPDGVAFVWAPVVDVEGASLAPAECIEDALWSSLLSDLDAAPVAYAQCLLVPGDATDRGQLARHGFVHAADLETMDRLVSGRLPNRVALRWNMISFDPEQNADRFASVVERTYVASRDCPAFTAHRTGLEALASHRAAGVFDPARWHLYEVDGSDAGVLLLSVHADERACELVYMGVVPEHRGKGIGRAMLIEGLHAAADWSCQAIFLAVDGANDFAKNLYRSLGFLPRALREAWVRWPGGRNPHGEHSGLVR